MDAQLNLGTDVAEWYVIGVFKHGPYTSYELIRWHEAGLLPMNTVIIRGRLDRTDYIFFEDFPKFIADPDIFEISEY